MTPGAVRATGRRAWWAHGPFVAALCLGLALRVTVMVAYRPVLLFPDSFGYLSHAVPFHLQWARPGGYLAFLWPILQLTDSRYPIPALQHLMGLALAVACYAFLLRRGIPRWGATLAALPVLLDPLQLVLEHYLLSDVIFELLLVGACLLLLWKPRPGPGALLAAGLAVAAATLTRGAGTLVLVVFVVALVCLRVGWRRMLVFLLAALVPLAGYATEFHREHGRWSLTSAGPRFLYARLAPIVHCDGVRLPSSERGLCPREPIGQRRVINYYIWGHRQAPQWTVQPPPGTSQLAMVADYDRRVVRSQPWVYGRSVIGHFALGFAPTRTVEVPGNPADHWLFEDHYWVLDDIIAQGLRPPSAEAGTSSDPAAASFLAGYRRWLWTPGPLLALLLVTGLAAAFGLRRARWSGDRVATGLLVACCVVPLATGAAVAGFSWRYQLQQLPLLPVAGALGLAALVRGRRAGRTVDPPVRVLDTMAERVVRMLPRGLAGAAGRGAASGRTSAVVAAVVAAAVAAVVAACVGAVSGALAAWSGWVDRPLAVAGGAAVGITIAVMLLVSRSRAAPD